MPEQNVQPLPVRRKKSPPLSRPQRFIAVRQGIGMLCSFILPSAFYPTAIRCVRGHQLGRDSSRRPVRDIKSDGAFGGGEFTEIDIIKLENFLHWPVLRLGGPP